MAGAKTVLTLDGDIGKLIQKQDKVIQKLKQQNKELRKTGRESRKAGADGASMGDKFTSSLKGMAAGLLSVGAASAVIRKIIGDIQELKRVTTETTTTLGNPLASLYAQFGIVDLKEQQDLRESLFATAHKAAMPMGQTTIMATQAGSAGLSIEQIKGGALYELLAAQKTAPIGSEGIVRPTIAYMKARGKSLTRENIVKTRDRMYGVFQKHEMQLADYEEMGKAGAYLSDFMTEREHISAQGILQEQAFKPSEASTGIRKTVAMLSTMRSSRLKVKGLARMGLTPEDVDLVGENVQTALRRYHAGLMTLPETERAGVMKEHFGVKTIGAVSALMKKPHMWEVMAGAQAGGAEAMQKGIIITAGTTSAAEEIRNQVEKERATFRESTGLREKAYGKIRHELTAARGRGDIGPVKQRLMSAQLWLGELIGMSPSEAARGIENELPGSQRILTERVSAISEKIEVHKKLEDALDKTTTALEKNSSVTEDNTRKVVSDPLGGSF